jgi:NAD(P)-dependent dehydrogenase (short-subunit alcohol dehydrogenase family)
VTEPDPPLVVAGRFEDRVAVVTGGASGIGAAVVTRLATEGASVVIADLDGARAAEVADATAGDVVAMHVDIGDEASVARFTAELAERFDHVDVLVNCAALTDPAHQARDVDVAQLDFDVWDRTLAVDLTGTMLMCRAVVPLMTRGGSIVTISSNAGLAGDTSLTAYAAAKAALHQLMRSIATAYGRAGIRSNAVSPAHIASPSFAANVPASVAAMLEANCLVPRLGRVDDVAAVVAFLASDEASFVTGETWRVDGGALAHLPTYADERPAQIAT